MQVLEPDQWQARARAHADRLDPYVSPHLARRRDGVKHPVHDFLFSYYSLRPAQLLRWHPGFGVTLGGADSYTVLKGYAQLPGAGVVTVDPDYVATQRPVIEPILTLLRATAGRSAGFGCFGLHEWAMVHRADETRHDWPLRLGREGTDRVVESHRIACTHFDAYRFFTDSARGLNTLDPTASDRPDFEQPGCLHAGMDLYKHAFRLLPMVSSDLVADCFELAWEIRELDMRAAPYDLSDLGYEPVMIETPEGKQAYAAAQRGFAERGAMLRARLIEACEDLMPARISEPN